MDFKKLRQFIYVAELGSLSLAAERLNIVQPALSQSIRKLEEELTVQLFTRSRNGMELTEAGTLFLNHARGVINQYNKAKESLISIDQNPSGTVSVAMIASALSVLTLPLWTQLDRDFPDIKLNVEEGLAATITQGFEDGLFDIIVTYPIKTSIDVHVESLIEEDLFLVSQYRKAYPPTIDLSQLEDVELIIPQSQHSVGGLVNKYAEELGIKLRPARVSAALHPTLTLLEHGYGYSLLPWSAINDRVRTKRLSASKVVNPGLSHKICMIYPSNRAISPAMRAVMRIIRASVITIHQKGQWVGSLAHSPNPDGSDPPASRADRPEDERPRS